MESIIISKSPEETFILGERLGQKLEGGEVICLYGELGAGKTVFAKGLGKGIGVAEEITSPTFTLIQEYTSDLKKDIKFIHMDLYRLQYPEEAETIGVFDYFQEDCVCLMEWPELIADSIPADILEINIVGSGDLPREISLKSFGQMVLSDLMESANNT
ncbi:MAG: tRNA threonylcarbamoyladenosine biosynthesis protein TsaE [Gracilibacter sp. BRH_c7a]|nr:MAG: tRNA threonylcarbamoyladenosine biosynthesis protein TsaE [Gracilibacter sp. BRH_c7a]